MSNKRAATSAMNSSLNSQPSKAPGFVNEMPSTLEFSQLWISALTCPIDEIETSVTYNPALEKKFDPVRRALLQCYRELRKSSFDLFNIEFAIWPASPFRAEIYDEGCSDIKFFAFKQGWADPHVLPVQVVIGLEGKSHVLVKFNCQWQPFEEWMRTFLPSEADIVPPATCDNLGRFWNYNEKHFRFFDLPAEIRDIIYDYAMFPEGHHRVIPFHKDLPSYLKVYTPKEVHNLNLLRANQQIREEASKLLYCRAKFNFRQFKTVEKFITGMQSKNLDHLRHVELHLTPIEFIDLFTFFNNLLLKHASNRPCLTVTPADFDVPRLGLGANALIFLKVRRLVLHFKHPAEPGASLKEKFTPDRSRPYWRDFCQKKLVERCLNLARPFTYKPWDRIEISGYVKNGQRERFFDSLPGYYDHTTDAWMKRIELPEDGEDGGVSIKGYTIPGLVSHEEKLFHPDLEGIIPFPNYTKPPVRFLASLGVDRVFSSNSRHCWQFDPEQAWPNHLYVYTDGDVNHDGLTEIRISGCECRIPCSPDSWDPDDS